MDKIKCGASRVGISTCRRAGVETPTLDFPRIAHFAYKGQVDCNIDYLKAIESQLESMRVLSPKVEAETMVTHFARMDRLDLFTDAKKVSPTAKRSIQKALAVRKKGVPLFYLTGQAPFYGRFFYVNKDVLIPRPETELMVEETMKVLDSHYSGKTPRIVDLGTGSGCIAASLTLERPDCRMTALDISTKALAVARKNFKRLGLSKKIAVYPSGLFSRFVDKKALWDVIVSNPPYIPGRDLRMLPREVRNEPRLALNGGRDGLFVVEGLLSVAPKYLKSNGWLLVEIGKGQSALLKKNLKKNMWFQNFKFVKDLNGIDRILIAQKNG